MVILNYLEIVLVLSGCCNKIPQNVAYNQQKCIAHSLDAGSPRLGYQHGLVRGPLPSLRPVTVLSQGGWVRELCGISLIRALILFMRAPPSGPDHLPEALPTNTNTLGSLGAGTQTFRPK